MATLQEEHLKELRHTYISYSMNSKVVFLTYPGLLTDDLKQLFIDNFQAITRYKYQDGYVKTYKPSDFPELYVKNTNDEYLVRNYFDSYVRAIQFSLLADIGRINLIEWVPGLHTRLYEDSYKDTKIIHLVPSRKDKARYLQYLLANQDYTNINLVADNYINWIKEMTSEAEKRLHQNQEVYSQYVVKIVDNHVKI